MSELNREQIIKALECWASGKPCKGGVCDLFDASTFTCDRWTGKNALALINSQEQRIKELTEENERLRGVGIPDDETYIKLSDAKHAIMAYIGEQTVSKYASSEECKAARNGAEGAMNELDYLIPAKVAPIADTVRKMQEKLIKGAFCSACGVDYSHHIIQIAKEMLEEG